MDVAQMKVMALEMRRRPGFHDKRLRLLGTMGRVY
jgi:hypothetical protein